uniref:Uncharacterized protein n=1 Tax=Megaselia scalaris TaxID=36166 RepID=T1GW97_MEGSC
MFHLGGFMSEDKFWGVGNRFADGGPLYATLHLRHAALLAIYRVASNSMNIMPLSLVPSWRLYLPIVPKSTKYHFHVIEWC